MHESHRAKEREQQLPHTMSWNHSAFPKTALARALHTAMASPRVGTEPVSGQNPQKPRSLYNWVSSDSQRAAREGANPSCYSSLPKSSLGPLIPLQRGTRGFVLAILSSTALCPEPEALLGSKSDALDQGQESTKRQAGAQHNSNEQVLGKERQESYIKRKSPSFWLYFSPKLAEFNYLSYYRTHCPGTSFLEKNLYC